MCETREKGIKSIILPEQSAVQIGANIRPIEVLRPITNEATVPR